MRFAYLAVLRISGWLALLAPSDRAKDAEILDLAPPGCCAPVSRAEGPGRRGHGAALVALARCCPGSHLRTLPPIVSSTDLAAPGMLTSSRRRCPLPAPRSGTPRAALAVRELVLEDGEEDNLGLG